VRPPSAHRLSTAVCKPAKGCHEPSHDRYAKNSAEDDAEEYPWRAASTAGPSERSLTTTARRSPVHALRSSVMASRNPAASQSSSRNQITTMNSSSPAATQRPSAASSSTHVCAARVPTRLANHTAAV